MYTHITEATAGFAGHKAQNTLADPNRAGPEAQRTQAAAPYVQDLGVLYLTLGSQKSQTIDFIFLKIGSCNKI